jgi:diguanylate cyclase (GGDEF)-like protein
MNKVNNILKENSELKGELEDMLGIVKENEIKLKGFKVVEYAFLLSEKLADYSEKPLKYLEEIFSIDKAVLFINSDEFDSGIFDESESLENVFFTDSKTFKYFYLEKRPYCGSGKINMIGEFDLLENMVSYLFSPVIENGKIVGSLNFYSYDKNRFEFSGSFDFIKDLSFKISISLRKMYNSRLIYQQSRLDDTTGIYNKFAMYDYLEVFINKFERYNNVFCFYLFDLDNFKKINDQYGHLEGDYFIKQIADGLKNYFRKSDIAGRFGGDEFFLIVPGGNENTKEIENKISGIVKDVCEKNNYCVNVGVSMGFVSVNEFKYLYEGKHYRCGLSPDKLIQTADKRLYENKMIKNRR